MARSVVDVVALDHGVDVANAVSASSVDIELPCSHVSVEAGQER